MSLKENLQKHPKFGWMLLDYTIITRDILDLFELREEELHFIEKLKKLKIPYEEISSLDKRLYDYNDIQKEIVSRKTTKKTWILIETKKLKKALFLIGSTRLKNDMINYYIFLEDQVRTFIASNENIINNNKNIEAIIENTLKKYSDIIDDKIISKLYR